MFSIKTAKCEETMLSRKQDLKSGYRRSGREALTIVPLLLGVASLHLYTKEQTKEIRFIW